MGLGNKKVNVDIDGDGIPDLNQKILYLEEYLEKLEEQHDKRIDQLEIKVYKR